MKYKGYNGDIEIEGSTLTITRSGLVAKAAFGSDAEPLEVPLQAIHEVHFKPASRLANGWVQVLTGGEDAPELNSKTAASNARTVLFTYKRREDFEQLAAWLDNAVQSNRALGTDPASFTVTGPTGQVGRFDTLAAKAEAANEEGQQAVTAAGVLFEGTSHDAGRNATVTLFVDRLERVKKARIGSLSRARQDVEVTPTRAVSSVQAKKDGMRYTKVTVYASGNSIEFRFGHAEASQFKDALMQIVLQGPPATVAAPDVPPAQSDVMDQLRKLGELRDAGVLSAEEFTAKKSELLGRL